MINVSIALFYFNASQKCLSSFDQLLVFGLVSLRINYFSSCQRFSIGFKSGDSAGVFHELCGISGCVFRIIILHKPVNCWVSAVDKGYQCLLWTYRNLSMIPSRMHTFVAPFRLISAHTCTFTGCLALRV